MLALRRIVPLRSFWTWLLAGLLLLPLRSGAQDKTPLQKELEGKTPRDQLVYLKGIVDEGKGTKETYFHLGNAYFQTGDPTGAVGAFQKAIELDPKYFKAMVNLALMYDEQERYSLAIETLERAAEIDPKSPDVWSHMGNSYYAQGEHSKAMDFYRKALGFNPNATHALYSIGVAFADAGIFREAVRYWTRVGELEPDSELGKNAAENVKLLQQYLVPH
ncbi:MAG TPA: tetratricopeptide repeat protein [Candidatus Krumholzibacteria bacterium]|nr:tetratricopeptide repeat protein [Candidatus Krumholzibacteria bacterium]